MTLTDKEKIDKIKRIVQEEWRKQDYKNQPGVRDLLKEINEIIKSDAKYA